MRPLDSQAISSSRTRFPIPLLPLLLALLAAMVSGCGTFPQTRTIHHAVDYSKTLLASWDDGSAVFLIRTCDSQDSEYSQPIMTTMKCRYASHSLLSGPLDLDVGEELRKSLRDNEKLRHAGGLTNAVSIPQTTFFDRPSSASRATDSRFVGVIGNEMVWLTKDSTGAGEGAPNTSANTIQLMDLGSRSSPGRYPALILRDKDDVWIFADRPEPCPEELCLSPAKVLGVDELTLPETLRRNFLVRYADASTERPVFRPVLPEALARYYGKRSGPFPKLDPEFEWDLDLRGTPDLLPSSDWTRCRIDERISMRVSYLYFIPLGEATTGLEFRLHGCKDVPKKNTIDKSILDSPLVRLQDHAPEASQKRHTVMESSSYFCFATPAADQPIEGSGPYGCSFILRDPETDAPMPFTPYLVQVRPDKARPNEPAELDVKGITNGEGRTAFVRSTSPLTKNRMRVVRRLVSSTDLLHDTNGIPGTSLLRDTKPFYGSKEGIQLECGFDYRMTLCSGLAFESKTDDEGWTAMYDPAEGDNCAVVYSLHVGKSRERPVSPR